ncbi:hypothetical protein GCM10010449_03440 [Streptomyces rectiviolaceus]|uniref:Transposase n=1 Tax=Streptomyces rectiviolaceus TaxID=332591 RepID=A0ABP6M6L7_9ACTN
MLPLVEYLAYKSEPPIRSDRNGVKGSGVVKVVKDRLWRPTDSSRLVPRRRYSAGDARWVPPADQCRVNQVTPGLGLLVRGSSPEKRRAP